MYSETKKMSDNNADNGDVNWEYMDKFSLGLGWNLRKTFRSRQSNHESGSDPAAELLDDLRRSHSPSPTRNRQFRPAPCSHMYCQRESEVDANGGSEIYGQGIKTGPFCHDNGQRVDGSGLLLQRIASLYDDQDLSDIQIVVGTKNFYAHKLLLCCSSDVFRVMLTNPQWPESQRAKVVLKEEPQCIKVFDIFLKFLYTGVIQLVQTNVLSVLMLADKYNVCDLREICVDYMCNHVVSVMEHNHAVSWLQYARLCNHGKLALACTEFIRWNFHKVICTQDFLQMEKEVLLCFLQDMDLVIPDEYTLYKGVLRWLNHQETKLLYAPLELKNIVMETLSLIRFPFVTPIQLQKLEEDPLAKMFQDFYLEKANQSIKFHASTFEQHNDLASISRESCQYQPRNYTNDTWGTLFSIDNFTSVPQHEIRPLFFSSPVSGSEADENRCWEWNVDLFPKGVLFQKCILIGLWRNLEICGTVYNTVRLTLESKTGENRKCDVSVLVTGVQDSVEYIRRVVQRRCSFDSTQRLHNFDDIVPYEQLNRPHSPYISGPDGNSFKVTIVIKPV